MDAKKIVEVRDQPERSVEPEVVERVVFVADRRPRFVLGFIVGAAILAAGVWFFAQPASSTLPMAAPMAQAESLMAPR